MVRVNSTMDGGYMELRKFKVSELPGIKKELIKRQKGVCPLCNRSLRTCKSSNVVVDHDHKTGVVRAALHRSCNGIDGKILRVLERWGSLKTLPAILDYLERLTTFWKLHQTAQTEWIYYGHKTASEKRLLINKRARLKRKKKRG